VDLAAIVRVGNHRVRDMAGIASVRNDVPLPAARAGEHVVQDGDTLGRIAKRHGLTLAALRAVNPSIQSSRDLQVGDTLRLRQAQARIASPTRHFSSDIGSDVHKACQ